ncbi:hypothetical protein GCM10022419_130280 [Nonomuraea rosea]|uniref:Uncharacterized protein n=1 Tax=Nonomuraea rosea TaxID=638574 RepID=A0ABP6ZYQ2_9ACTN
MAAAGHRRVARFLAAIPVRVAGTISATLPCLGSTRVRCLASYRAKTDRGYVHRVAAGAQARRPFDDLIDADHAESGIPPA